MVRVGTVFETEHWKFKIFSPPREHGPPHVHVRGIGMNAEVRINLLTFEVMGETNFSRKAVLGILECIHINHEYLLECWENLHGKNKKA